MKNETIIQILVLLLIILSYMYFTKKNCKKTIEGLTVVTNKGGSTHRRESIDTSVMGEKDNCSQSSDNNPASTFIHCSSDKKRNNTDGSNSTLEKEDKLKTDGTVYLPLDMPGQEMTNSTWQECQKRCADNKDCVFFNSFENGDCYITDGSQGIRSGGENPTSKSGRGKNGKECPIGSSSEYSDWVSEKNNCLCAEGQTKFKMKNLAGENLERCGPIPQCEETDDPGFSEYVDKSEICKCKDGSEFKDHPTSGKKRCFRKCPPSSNNDPKFSDWVPYENTCQCWEGTKITPHTSSSTGERLKRCSPE